MAKFGINDILNAKTKAAGQQAQTDGYKEIYLSPYEVKAAQENTHQKLENIEELADSFLHVGQEQPTVLARVNGEYRIIDGHRRNATMKTGDVIEINTKYGSKGAKLIRDGVETDYFRYIDVDSTFMQLAIGDNMFRYDAASGVNSLEVSIFYSKEFLGV